MYFIVRIPVVKDKETVSAVTLSVIRPAFYGKEKTWIGVYFVKMFELLRTTVLHGI